MLSLVLGSEITDASVAAIASSYPNLELLDLSGYVFPPKSSCIQLSIRQLIDSNYQKKRQLIDCVGIDTKLYTGLYVIYKHCGLNLT